MTTRAAVTPPNLIDLLSSEVVFAWLPIAHLEDARRDVERGRITRPAITPRRVSAYVSDGKAGRVRVRIEWEGRGPMSHCSCPGEAPCRHAASLALLLVGGAAMGVSEDEPDAEEGQMGEPRAEADEPSAADRERDARVKRGQSELFSVHAFRAGAIYGRFEVSSPSSRRYEVTMRALDELHNGCSCPDFETNLLGTCKHIEAVLHHLRTTSARAYARTAKADPPASYLHLLAPPEDEWAIRVDVRLGGGAGAEERRLRARYFAAGALDEGALSEVWTDVRAAAIAAGVEVPAEVALVAERALSAQKQAARQQVVAAAVRSSGTTQPGFRAPLYPYQVEGVAFLASRGRALLADDMGLGKTAQAIAATLRLMREGEVRRVLIVCPASLKHQWQSELERFAGLGHKAGDVVVVGGPRELRRQQYSSGAAIVITSYELARSDETEVEALTPDLLILDEAQRIRNWRTRTSTAIKRIRSRFAFVLTGTPLENRLDDFYSLMQVVDPQLLGPLWRFNAEFTTTDERGKILGYRHLDRLRARAAPRMLRRRREEVLTELPERVTSRLFVPLDAMQRPLHDEAQDVVARLIAILKRRPLSPVEEQRLMRGFQRMRMACDAAGLVDKETEGAPKLDELAGLLDEICLQGGHKVVIFSEWERMQELAARVCTKLGVGHVRLHGGVPTGARGALIQRFRDDATIKVFFSTDAGGVGLNLQVASHVINLDLPWNPAVLAQRIARVHRLGQRRPVNVVLLVSEDSFESRMEATLDGKRALFAAAVGDDAETTELDRASFASRIATMLSQTFAAATGSDDKAPPLANGEGVARAADDADADRAAATIADPVEAARARFGDALVTLVRLSNGALLSILRGEAPPAMQTGAAEAVGSTQAAGGTEAADAQHPSRSLTISASAAKALSALGDFSPLDGAQVLYEAPVLDDNARRRGDQLQLAERKERAGSALVSAGLYADALLLFRDSTVLCCRALDENTDPGEDPASLLAAIYGRLIPSGALSSEEAHAVSRTGELARAFAASSVPVPEALVKSAALDALALLERVRARSAR